MLEKLPELFCITTTKESNDTISKYIGYHGDRTIGNHYCFERNKLPDYRGWMYYASERKNGYTEISFDDFKRLVLGETINNEMIIEIW